MKTLLLLLDSMIYYDRQILKGIKAKLDETNLNVELHLECSSNLDYILSRSWDYVIADYDKPNINHIVDSLSAKIVVFSNHQLTSFPSHVSSIVLDNRGLAQTALQGLKKAGFSRVAYYSNQQDSVSPWSKERHIGFKHSASSFGLEFVDSVECAITDQDFPLGVYCSSDRSARRLANLCRNLGIEVPKHVSIIGNDYDDTERMLSPMPLSSVELNSVDLGKLCIEVLQKVLRFNRVQRASFSSYKLIHGRTTPDITELDQMVIKAEGYMRNNFHQNMKIKQVTDYCRISRKTLDTRFVIAHGVTAHQFVTQLRLNRAKDLLASTTEKLDAIAKQCGYPGQSYLSQVFIKQLGVSPNKYRLNANSIGMIAE
ncbi:MULTISPECIES: substrate-binding domain-containing protein [unclassified Vibrio]|uniref:substrate-binding domain-containing protein n=1 Tax=unclassified Vibrio TaxID=2614977 RepID=UPI00159DBF73|nr:MULTISPECIES: substrate-binding domain-containing protein [unclassified Vibrio]NVN80572.1 helix-turn-helix domain-containing protein [Vibrio sp. Scap16]QLE95614.1 helix-turn-helix domain-containing protein [Vibrio sp. Scap24]